MTSRGGSDGFTARCDKSQKNRHSPSAVPRKRRDLRDWLRHMECGCYISDMCLRTWHYCLANLEISPSRVLLWEFTPGTRYECLHKE